MKYPVTLETLQRLNDFIDDLAYEIELKYTSDNDIQKIQAILDDFKSDVKSIEREYINA